MKKTEKKNEKGSNKRVASEDDHAEGDADDKVEEENIPTKKTRRNVIESDEDE